MPTERALVGGGIRYDNSVVSGGAKNYYQFSYFDNISAYPCDKNYFNNSASNYGSMACSALFTDVLPYQNASDASALVYSFYGNYPGLLMTFGLPVVLTKYRMWNGFKQNIVCTYNGGFVYNTDSNIGYETPQEWTLYGSNDYITWTTIDSRTGQALFPYATDRLCSNSPYVEYSIASPAAYKWYKLSITKGGRTASYCYKGNCDYKNFQIGALQLWGYEDPTTPCSLHGYDSLFTGIIYKNSSNVALSPATTGVNSHPANAFGQTIANIYSDPVRPAVIRAWSTSYSGAAKYPNTSDAYLDFGIAVAISAYKLKSQYQTYSAGWRSAGHSAKNWTLNGSNDFSSWTTLSTVTNAPDNANYNSYSVSSPAAYRYYKLSISDGYWNYCNKNGCYFNFDIGEIQLMGTIS